MRRPFILNVVVISVAGLACDNAVKDPYGGGPGHTGGAPATGTGGASGGSPGQSGGSTGQSGGSSGTIGTGGGSAGSTGGLPQCTFGVNDSFSPVIPGAAPPDSKMVNRQDCQPFSGCKTFSVVRDASDRLLSATFDHDPSVLPAFAEALGIPLDLEATCRTNPATACYVNEVRTYYRLVIQADTTVRLGQVSNATATVGGRSFRFSLSDAFSARGDGPSPTCGTDAGPFWGPGAVHFAMAAAAP